MMEQHPLVVWGWRMLCGLGGISSLVLALLYFFQDKLVYVPNIPGYPTADYWQEPDSFGFEYETVWLRTSDGVKLHGWFLRLREWSEEQMKKRPVIMFFQENAGSMVFRLPYLRAIAMHTGCPIFAPSYRGYGLSEGKPSQAGLMLDAQAALEHVLARSGHSGKVVVFGRSLGGAVGIHLAALHQDKLAGLIVENTFTSVEDMAGKMLPPLALVLGSGRPLNFIVTNRWRNEAEIGRITRLPLMMIVSMRDEMVPPQHMLRLRSLQRASSLDWVQCPSASHMDAYDADPATYWPAMAGFFRRRLGVPAPGELS